MLLQNKELALNSVEPLDGDAVSAIVDQYQRHTVADVTFPTVFSRAHGCRAWTSDGECFLDLIGGYGVMSTGWNHPRLVARVREQAERTLFAPPMLPTVESTRLAMALIDIMGMPDGWKCVRATGGADANEQALKAVDAWADQLRKPRPRRIIRYRGAYHGGTSTMLALSDPGQLGGVLPGRDDHPLLPLPRAVADVQRVVDLLDRDPAIIAVMVEPVIGSGGVHPFPLDYLSALREVCTDREIALIFDEVITGCGRVGAMLYADFAHVEPDAVTLGKGLSAGAAVIGAALLAPHLAEAMSKREDTSSTFAWSPLACAVALENLAIIEHENLPSKAALIGDKLRAEVARIVHARLGEERARVRGVGMMVGVDLCLLANGPSEPSLIKRLLLRCKREGLWVGASWDWRTLVLLPPLVMTRDEVGEAMERFERAVKGVGK